MKRILAMLLAAMLVLSMGVVAFAEGNVSSQEALNAAITAAEGETVINLADGTYNLLLKDGTTPNMVDKVITFKGGKNVIFDLKGIVGATWHTQDTGATFTFEGVTVKWSEDNEGYQGFANADKVVYKNCTIYGTQFMGGNADFIDCVFEAANTQESGYAVYGRGAGTLTFKGCTFNTDGRAIMLYQDQTTEVTVEMDNCTFNDNGKYTSKPKAVVETGDGTAQTSKFNITINNCVANGFETNKSTSNLWGNKDSIPADRLNVTVTGISKDVTPSEGETSATKTESVTVPASGDEAAKTATVTVSNSKPADVDNETTVTKVIGLENVVASDEVKANATVTVAVTAVKENTTGAPTTEQTAVNTAIAAIEEKMADHNIVESTVEYIDITITAGTNTPVTKLSAPVTFVVEGEFDENTTMVYRYHDNKAEALNVFDGNQEGYKVIDENTLHLYLSKFSTFAIVTKAKATVAEPETRPDPCDHDFDENGKCKDCGIIVIDHTANNTVTEANPNTGAESAVAVVAAVAALALAGIAVSKK